jgi:pSer/pThr/pTyr-binding forkhead associated (FHA) protein
MEYRDFRFRDLEKFSQSDILILNRAYDVLAGSERTELILKSLGEVLLSFDIYNVDETEISLLVKPAGSIGKPQFFKMTEALISVGRTTDNNISLKSPLVSKRHAEIYRKGIDYYLRDLNSNNGTFLNQVKLNSGGEIILRNDDVIKIDPFEIVVSLPPDLMKHPLEISLAGVRVGKDIHVRNQAAVFLQLQPTNQVGLLLLDRQVARWMIQKIITGQKPNQVAQWSEIEAGLLDYIAAKVLATVNPFLQNSRLVLESIQNEEEALQDWFKNNPSNVEVTFQTKTEVGSTYAFLYLPAGVYAEVKSSPSVSDFLARASWLRKLPYSVSVNLGVSFLSADQITMLEPGDIILLDRADIVLEDGNPKGKIEFRSPQLRRGVITGSLLCTDNGSAKITVEALYQEGLKGMSEASKKSEAPQSAGGEGVLSSIEIPVVVQFANLPFTLEELSLVKEGQVIELKKSQPEIVDLTVDGKVIASGKLVDVDGKLGVRILKILR